MLSVSLSHQFPNFALDVAFEAPAGVTALFGRSGSGKTTVVNAVAGLLRPDTGRVAVDGETLLDTRRRISIPAHKRRVGYVFQEGRLFPHMTVERNLAYGAWFAEEKPDRIETTRIIEMLGIGHLLQRRPASLSGGEKQRVAIGRALLSKPRLLLMDEPLAALDEARKAEILPYLERLNEESEIPMLYVTHSVAEVARLATTIVILEEGRIARSGPASALLSDPNAARNFGLSDAGAVIHGHIRAQSTDGLTEVEVSGGRLWLPQQHGDVGAPLRVRIAAQDVMIALEAPEGLSALNILPVHVTEIRKGEGPGVMVQLRLGEDLILARITGRSYDALRLSVGTQCYAIIKAVAVAKRDIGFT